MRVRIGDSGLPAVQPEPPAKRNPIGELNKLTPNSEESIRKEAPNKL
jgi:hypothetical protein